MNGYQQKRVIEALNNSDKLTDWEYEFIDRLADQEDDYILSEKQNAILNRISQKMLDPPGSSHTARRS
ncbi:MAG: hypothetical protein ACREB3_00410 [Burkholderiales bacterium]